MTEQELGYIRDHWIKLESEWGPNLSYDWRVVANDIGTLTAEVRRLQAVVDVCTGFISRIPAENIQWCVDHAIGIEGDHKNADVVLEWIKEEYGRLQE